LTLDGSLLTVQSFGDPADAEGLGAVSVADQERPADESLHSAQVDIRGDGAIAPTESSAIISDDTHTHSTTPMPQVASGEGRSGPDAVAEVSVPNIDLADGVPAAENATKPDLSVIRLIEKADHSAGKLVNLLAKHFPAFRDETRFDGKRVRLLKRAQIFVADLWAAFGGKSYGEFHDIDHLTMKI